MKGLVAYSKPRGKFGVDYVFIVVIDFDESYETATINVDRPGTGTYSCGSCGSYGFVTIHNTIQQPTETSRQGSLHFYRYDNVHDGDEINIYLNDPGLLYQQNTSIEIEPLKVSIETHLEYDEEKVLKELPKSDYPMFLIDWDKHSKALSTSHRSVTVEDELITKVMNNEPITITELLLEPPTQPLASESGKHFIEGQLRYL